MGRTYEQLPMWYRRDGGLVITEDEPGTRVVTQTWRTLVLDAFPSDSKALPQSTMRRIFEKKGDLPTTVTFDPDGAGHMAFHINCTLSTRTWVIRIHLAPGQDFA